MGDAIDAGTLWGGKKVGLLGVQVLYGKERRLAALGPRSISCLSRKKGSSFDSTYLEVNRLVKLVGLVTQEAVAEAHSGQGLGAFNAPLPVFLAVVMVAL